MSTNGPLRTQDPRRARASGRWRPALTGVSALLLTAACAVGSGAPRAPGDPGLQPGIEALAAGGYGEAGTRLRDVASRCEAGAPGRRAVLLLAAMALDPRNPDASPDDGARIAAHYLDLPGAGADDRVVAETLYLMARGFGAAPGGSLEADTAASAVTQGLASRFGACRTAAEGDGAASARPLPELPDTAYAARLRADRDRLAARVTALEAELQRIRALLQEGVVPDTSGGRP